MTNFFLRSARQAKRLGDSRERIQLMQQIADNTEWSIKDFTQFGQLMRVSEFRSEYDTSLYSLDPKCEHVMLYPQMYYIHLLTNGKWSYDGLFGDEAFSHRELMVVEEYVYSEILKLEKSST